MIVQVIKIKSGHNEEDLMVTAKERAPMFEALPGLIQKYYVRLGEPGEFAGIYIWESKEAMAEYQKSELAATIPQAYKVLQAPDVEIMDVLFELRP